MAALCCLTCSERRTLTLEVGYAVGHNSSPQLPIFPLVRQPYYQYPIMSIAKYENLPLRLSANAS
jgi:hypothetical protein